MLAPGIAIAVGAKEDLRLDLAEALEHAIARSKTRGITHTNFATQAESSGFQMQIAEAAMKIDTAFLHARRAHAVAPDAAVHEIARD